MPGTLTKNDIVRTLAEKYELEIAATRRVVQGTLDLILEALLRDDKVELRNFGVFDVIQRKGRIARYPLRFFMPSRRYREGGHSMISFQFARVAELLDARDSKSVRKKLP